MHRKHGIDRGTEMTEGSGPGEGMPVGSVTSLLEKLVKTYFQHNCTAPDFRDLVRCLSSRYCQYGLFNCSQSPAVAGGGRLLPPTHTLFKSVHFGPFTFCL